MKHAKGTSVPFFPLFALCSPRSRADALLNRAIEAFQAGHLADALVDAESLCRSFPRLVEPAALRAHVLQTGRPALAAAAWRLAWQRRPDMAPLQDAMLRAWLAQERHDEVVHMASSLFPERCREGSEKTLLDIFFEAGGDCIGACWRDGDDIAGKLYARDADATPLRMLTLDDGTCEFRVSVPCDGTPFAVAPPHQAAVWSVTTDGDGSTPRRLVQGSPLVFAAPQAVAANRIAPIAAAVAVVIPVYLGAALARACIGSVIDSLDANRTAATITVVDDATPDAELAAWLEALALAGRITLLRNRVNLGFIETVNRGLAAHPDRDALLLNADTVVHGDWIDRMRASMYRGADVASVSAWSNNGEISSFPEIAFAAPMPSLQESAAVDAVAAELHAQGRLADVELPVCCGFAMLMRRAALDAVGALDGRALRRGYGEEVDWCLRAAAAGYRHALSAGVFIAHAGGASFGAEKALRVAQNDAVVQARYPWFRALYDAFLRTDPLAAQRSVLAGELERRRPSCADGAHWLDRARQAGSQASLPTESHKPLPRAYVRVAIWDHAPDDGAARAVLALARTIATAGAPLRLLVFGAAGAPLLHTGVVDAIPFHFSELGGGLPNAVVLGLAGCDEILAAPSRVQATFPVHMRVTRIDAGFDPARWLARRLEGGARTETGSTHP